MAGFLAFQPRYMNAKKVMLVLGIIFTASFLLQKPILEQYSVIPFTKIVLREENTNYRIQLAETGRCIVSPDGVNLEFSFCEPTQQQTFKFLNDSSLAFTSNGLCVVLRKSEAEPRLLLKLGHCSEAVRFQGDSYLQLRGDASDSKLCVSRSKLIKPNPAVLSQCEETLSRFNIIEESNFIARRKALMQSAPVDSPDCNFPACNLNKRPPPVELLPSSEVTRCYNLTECVTVVIKTARRPHLVLRLAQSLRDMKGYDLPIIAYDDGVGPHSDEMMSKIAAVSNLKYIIGDEKDIGIALGRTRAVEMVETKYFLLCDDDLIFEVITDIELFAEILDTTDASVAGGKFHRTKLFGGYFHFTSLDNENKPTDLRILNFYQGACSRINETIVGFPSCFRCEITPNIFMAKTADVLKVGCWSEELKISEHKDLFLRLKAAGKKVVSCPKVKIFNQGEDNTINRETGFFNLRIARIAKMRRMFGNVWNVHKVYIWDPQNDAFLKHKDKILS